MIKNLASLLIIAALCSACATSPTYTADPSDPWQGFNRKVFAFNEVADKYLLKPVAKGYQKLMPQPVDDAIDT